MSDLWLIAVGKTCSAYESGVKPLDERGLFYFLWKLNKWYSKAGNCKNCKEGPMIKAEGYCPLRGGICPCPSLCSSHMTKDKFAKQALHRQWWSGCSSNSEAWLVLRVQFWFAKILNLTAAPEDELWTEKAWYHSKHSEIVKVRFCKLITLN